MHMQYTMSPPCCQEGTSHCPTALQQQQIQYPNPLAAVCQAGMSTVPQACKFKLQDQTAAVAGACWSTRHLRLQNQAAGTCSLDCSHCRGLDFVALEVATVLGVVPIQG